MPFRDDFVGILFALYSTTVSGNPNGALASSTGDSSLSSSLVDKLIIEIWNSLVQKNPFVLKKYNLVYVNLVSVRFEITKLVNLTLYQLVRDKSLL